MAATRASALPPGPRLPRWLQTAGFIVAPMRWMEANRRRYGDAVTYSTLFGPKFVMAYHPELIKQIFRASPEQLRAGEANPFARLLGERSLLLLDGAEHMRQRKLMLPPFHGTRVRAYEQAMREATDRAIDAWPVNEPFALMSEMQAVTLNVIARAVFGVEEGPRQEDLKERVLALLAPHDTRLTLFLGVVSAGRLGGSGRERLMRDSDRVTEAVLAEIAHRRSEPDLEEREDVLSMLILARDEDGRAMTDAELRDELVTLLVAGHETTAHTLAWAFDFLLRHPAPCRRVREEIAGGEHEYTDAVVKEALRIRPVVPGLARKVGAQPFQLGEHLIPPGVQINPSIAMIHRRADYYPHPDRFEPERFLRPGAPDTYTWVPFGGGIRRCIGAPFATFEMREVIHRVLERTELELVRAKPERAVRRDVTIAPKHGVPVRLAARRSARHV